MGLSKLMVFGVPTAAYVLDPFAKKVLNDHPKIDLDGVCILQNCLRIYRPTSEFSNAIPLEEHKHISCSALEGFSLNGHLEEMAGSAEKRPPHCS